MTPTTFIESATGAVASAQITVAVPSVGVIFLGVKSTSGIETGATSSLGGALTPIQQITVGGFYLSVYKLDAAAVGSHVITVTSSSTNLRYLGAFCVPGGAYDVSGSSVMVGIVSGIPNTMTAGSITTTAADLVFEWFYGVSGTLSPTVGTAPNAFTAIPNPIGAGGNCWGMFQQSAAGTINPTGQTAVNGNVLGISFAAKPAGAAVTAPPTGAPVESYTGSGVASSPITVTGVPAGASIVVVVRAQSAPTGCSDTQQGAYTLKQSINSSSQFTYLYTLAAAAAGTHNITVTSAAPYIIDVIAFWVPGTAVDATAGAIPSFGAGTGADVLSGGSVTPSVAGETILGIFNTVSGGAPATPGTAPNAFGLIYASPNVQIVIEGFAQGAAAPIAATAGTGTAGEWHAFTVAIGNVFVAYNAAINEAAAALDAMTQSLPPMTLMGQVIL